QKTSSVAVTQGWGSHDLLADLGNNAVHSAQQSLHMLQGRHLVSNQLGWCLDLLMDIMSNPEQYSIVSKRSIRNRGYAYLYKCFKVG
ncbi:hypothetical protein ACK32X_22360, partial [Aeromonas dhakensis]